jgi:crotonobetainyl-CoA:carnitine CoA-transferase CaiB-like acyl-CoA transferase
MESEPPKESTLLVISLEQAVAAPLCSRKLADMGARVVKVEQPAGDFARGYDRAVKGQSSYFVWLNRGKESISLDLRHANDVALLESMASRADVFIQNSRPGTLPELGIDISKWRRTNPRLVTCSISGYGTSGPDSRRKAYDLLVQAESGLASITGSPAEPARVGISVIDIAAGVTAYEAILEALLRRTFTGLGDHIEVSLFDAIAEWMAVPLLHAAYAKAPRRVGLMHPSIAPYGAYDCADGARVLFSVQNEREWVAFSDRVMTRASLRMDPRFRDNCARVYNREALDALIGEVFGASPSEHICRLLDDADIAYGLINELDAVLKHPRLRQCEVETPAGTIALPAPAARHERATARIGAVPSLNQHGASIRSEFA